MIDWEVLKYTFKRVSVPYSKGALVMMLGLALFFGAAALGAWIATVNELLLIPYCAVIFFFVAVGLNYFEYLRMKRNGFPLEDIDGRR